MNRLLSTLHNPALVDLEEGRVYFCSSDVFNRIDTRRQDNPTGRQRRKRAYGSIYVEVPGFAAGTVAQVTLFKWLADTVKRLTKQG